jgi:hypothetical protein
LAREEKDEKESESSDGGEMKQSTTDGTVPVGWSLFALTTFNIAAKQGRGLVLMSAVR